MFRSIIVVLSFMITSFFASSGSAAPSIKVLSTTQSVEKGGIFQIRVEISTNETIKNILIVPITPDGFVVDPMDMPGIKASQNPSNIQIEQLEEGSSITVSFKAWPPGLTGKTKKGEKEAFYDTRGEPKSFIFNVFYTDLHGKVNKSQTASVNVRYTTSVGYYLLFGMLGIIIGHVVKTGTQNKSEISESLMNAETKSKKLFRASSYIFVSRLPAFLTLVIVGFGALLVLAKESIPVTGWHQAMALGIGLAILTDEQLLAKIKS